MPDFAAGSTVRIHARTLTGDVDPFFYRFLVRSSAVDMRDVGLFCKGRRARFALARIDDEKNAVPRRIFKDSLQIEVVFLFRRIKFADFDKALFA